MTAFTFHDSILAHHSAVLGKTGSGKTSTAKLIIEQVAGSGARVCILDPIKSDWWGLTSSADGKRAGLPFHILGGPRGHVPLHESAGKAIGEIVASGALPLSIVDMADFKMGGLQKFFCDFAEALLKKMRGNVYLVLEEAHEFAPKERAGVAGEHLGVYWAKKLATAGRSKGLRLIVLTQRTQALHNALLGSCESLIVHRMTAPADQKPATDWLKANAPKQVAAEIAGSLSSLKTGEGWLCSGEAELFERRQFPRIATYDNTSGKAGERTVKTSAVDAEALRGIIGEAIEEAKANDPALLRQRIVELEKFKKLTHDTLDAMGVDKCEGQKCRIGARLNLLAKPAAVDPAAIERAVNAAVAREHGAVREMLDKAESVLKGIDGGLAEVREQLGRLRGTPLTLAQLAPDVRGSIIGVAALPLTKLAVAGMNGDKRAVATVGRMVRDSGDASLPAGERKILTAIAQHPEGVTRSQLSVLADYKRSSRDAYLQRLQAKGFVELVLGGAMATPAGIAALGDFEPLPTGAALAEYWLANLPEGEAKILAVLIERYPEAVPRDAISEAVDYKRSSRDAYIQRLKARQLVTADSRGVTASPLLFD